MNSNNDGSNDHGSQNSAPQSTLPATNSSRSGKVRRSATSSEIASIATDLHFPRAIERSSTSNSSTSHITTPITATTETNTPASDSSTPRNTCSLKGSPSPMTTPTLEHDFLVGVDKLPWRRHRMKQHSSTHNVPSFIEAVIPEGKDGDERRTPTPPTSKTPTNLQSPTKILPSPSTTLSILQGEHPSNASPSSKFNSTDGGEHSRASSSESTLPATSPTSSLLKTLDSFSLDDISVGIHPSSDKDKQREKASSLTPYSQFVPLQIQANPSHLGNIPKPTPSPTASPTLSLKKESLSKDNKDDDDSGQDLPTAPTFSSPRNFGTISLPPSTAHMSLRDNSSASSSSIDDARSETETKTETSAALTSTEIIDDTLAKRFLLNNHALTKHMAGKEKGLIIYALLVAAASAATSYSFAQTFVHGIDKDIVTLPEEIIPIAADIITIPATLAQFTFSANNNLNLSLDIFRRSSEYRKQWGRILLTSPSIFATASIMYNAYPTMLPGLLYIICTLRSFSALLSNSNFVLKEKKEARKKTKEAEYFRAFRADLERLALENPKDFLLNISNKQALLKVLKEAENNHQHEQLQNIIQDLADLSVETGTYLAKNTNKNASPHQIHTQTSVKIINNISNILGLITCSMNLTAALKVPAFLFGLPLAPTIQDFVMACFTSASWHLPTQAFFSACLASACTPLMISFALGALVFGAPSAYANYAINSQSVANLFKKISEGYYKHYTWTEFLGIASLSLLYGLSMGGFAYTVPMFTLPCLSFITVIIAACAIVVFTAQAAMSLTAAYEALVNYWSPDLVKSTLNNAATNPEAEIIRVSQHGSAAEQKKLATQFSKQIALVITSISDTIDELTTPKAEAELTTPEKTIFENHYWPKADELTGTNISFAQRYSIFAPGVHIKGAPENLAGSDYSPLTSAQLRAQSPSAHVQPMSLGEASKQLPEPTSVSRTITFRTAASVTY